MYITVKLDTIIFRSTTSNSFAYYFGLLHCFASITKIVFDREYALDGAIEPHDLPYDLPSLGPVQTLQSRTIWSLLKMRHWTSTTTFSSLHISELGGLYVFEHLCAVVRWASRSIRHIGLDISDGCITGEISEYVH